MSTVPAWLLWLALVLGSFGVLEGYALTTGKWTLSECMWRLFKAWPPIAVVFGIVVGGLAVHFFWVGPGCSLFRP